MGFTAVEQSTVERLKRAVEARTVIPVVGAGVSRQAAQLPCWADLLASALKWTRDNKEALGVTAKELADLHRRLSLDAPSPGCYETWATRVFCRNSSDLHWKSPLYREWLETTFEPSEPPDQRIYTALKALEPRVVITTNYDKLLSYELLPDCDVVTWDGKEAIRTLLREGRGVLHLHGMFDEPESVVLTAHDYGRVAQDDLRSTVSHLLTSHSILLFIGVSPAGATDRHLAELLRLSVRPRGDAPQRQRTHVLLHRGKLPAGDVAKLKELDIQPLSFGDDYDDLAPFIEQIGERNTAIRKAAELVVVNHDGPALKESEWAPQRCLDRVGSSLRFMGLRSSKWVSDRPTLQALEGVLDVLDSRGSESVKFLILNPRCEAYRRLEGMRRMTLSSDHLRDLADLEQRHRSLVVRCVDFISAFRFTAVDDMQVGLALYPSDPREFRDTAKGWRAPHYSLHTKSWSLARSLLFSFDEHFQNADPLREVMPELFA